MEIAIITLIITSLTILTSCILHLKLRHVNSVCCSSDCIPSRNNTPPLSPINSKSQLLTS